MTDALVKNQGIELVPVPYSTGGGNTVAESLKRFEGEDFAALVQEVSAADHTDGGQMGLRRMDRYPPSFMAATGLTSTMVADGVITILCLANSGCRCFVMASMPR